MIIALAIDRIDFVKLFLHYGISIHALLTPNLLEFLYGYRSQGAHSILRKLKKGDYKPAEGDYEGIMNLLCFHNNYDRKAISLSSDEIKRVQKDASFNFLKEKTFQEMRKKVIIKLFIT